MTDKAAAATSFFAGPQDGLLERTLLEAAPDGVLLVDRAGHIQLVNAALEKIAGRTRAQLLGRPLDVLLPASVRHLHAKWLARFFARPSARPVGWLRNLHVPRPGGSKLPVEVTLGHCVLNGQPFALAFVRDASGMRHMQAQVHFMARHDALTGLVNRWQFEQSLQLAMVTAPERHMAVVLVDLNDFQRVNDGHGLEAGDQVLLETAYRMRSILSVGGMLGHFGGNTFAIFLPDVQHDAALERTLQGIQASLAEPFQVQGDTLIEISGALGAARFPQDARDDARSLVRCAFMALAHAKTNQGGNYALYRPEMGQRIEERAALQDRLRLALKEKSLQLHYQPQMDLRSGRITSVEALLRWDDAVLGSVGPDRFVPVAEASGLILTLGDWVLETALAQQAQWAAQGVSLQMGINLSAHQLRESNLATRLSELLKAKGLGPSAIELEITESQAMTDPQNAVELLSQLATQDIGLALDDFGTGHSSLAYLQMLPVRRLKIDRSFVHRLPHQTKDVLLVQSIIALAHELGLEVVAEGVETQEQLDFLQAAGCDHYQGWLLAKAMPPEQLLAWMQDTGGAESPSCSGAGAFL
ncbi:putative bifunctional diguanylate cyclase/phosphodiesterase [Extensimonas sp. H3M7-6]|uniref:putative bifunctional diguanylate cyclase/phosphodiesterase n=1 Tax=Extensimonas soli TaxID=3031322 RepID=UPI0023DB63C7|nr:GGDEF domain-containing phosphodiesterase [Extensimonas sp. H3M7-6]MDF1482601.1 EAL domain-containing protein [Extensimonas sp. H3M7-6]